MSIQLKNEIRALVERLERLERIINVMSPEKRTIAGVTEPEPEDNRPKKRGRPKAE